MVTKELLDYIKTKRQQGIGDEAIKEDLLKTNWKLEDITIAFNSIDKGTPLPQAPSSSVDTKTIVVLVALILFYPLGLILMWWWMKKWPLIIKGIISIVLLFLISLFLYPIALSYYYQLTNKDTSSSATPTPIDTANFIFPTANASLCMNQTYTLSWELPLDIQSVKIGIAQPNSDSAIDITDMIPAYATKNKMSEKGSYSWVAGQSRSKIPLQPGYGYRILLTGQLQAPVNGDTYYWSNNFYLKDCSANTSSSQSATQTVPTKVPTNNNGVCSTSDGCNRRSPGSGYACNAEGNFDATGSYWCTCDSSCNMTIK